MAVERPLLDPPPSSDLPAPLPEPPIRPDHTAPSHRRTPSFSLEPPDPFRRPLTAPNDRLAASLRERELSDSDARIIYLNDPRRTNDRAGFAGNSIRTAKYSILTFIPRNLFEQFHRLAYVYFLAIAVLNQLPQLAVFGRGASLLPLAFVLFVTAIKDAYEDFRRHRSDRLENNRTVNTLNSSGQFVPKRWKHLKVGEIIRVSSDETLPADIVLLATSGSTGVAYVQTINLDGESNLKTRYAKQETLSQNPQNGTNITIRCERPNRNIYGFHANLEISNKIVSLGPSNIVLRGCELKNTTWAVGAVVYAGPETKVMLNSSGAPSKRSRLESHMNKETLLLSVLLVIMCSVVAILNGIWLVIHKNQLINMQYFRLKDYSTGVEKNYNYYGIAMQVFITFLMAVIVFQIMIPISLYISMELVRLGQAYFMVRDSDLYDESSNSRFQCRALNINEDLGQIKYVFSDKTGTLTENKMEFNCATIRGVDYSNGVMDVNNSYSVVVGNQLWKPKVQVKTDPDLVQLLKQESSTTEKGTINKWAQEFFLALATCNTIVPIVLDTADPAQKLIEYQGESPDEQALVYAAASYGFVLVERSSGHIVVHVLGQRQRYELLGVHEFDSDRKRMSVIVNCPDKTVKLFTKGADNSMLNILNPSLDPLPTRHTESHLHCYSSLGLRTLVIASRSLAHSDLATWQAEYHHASTAVFGRGNLLKNLVSKIETDLELLGATGIEDRLQKGVAESIEGLRETGIRVWVLTGDKQETAISVGYSCKLLTGQMARIVINENSRDGCRKSLEDAVGTVGKHRAGFDTGQDSLALVIDGNSLVYILDSDLEELLFKVATACDVVLCCRVAPLQKAGIVALIKNRTDDMTLAIGDGANDVSMIQMADVGIGMSGQEGRQAVMASDFALAQFRFILPLLLVHGHWNYQRMSYMILYNFYKNSTFVFVLFWYVLYTAYSLTTAVTEWSSMLYSVLYTALPTIIVAILDKNLSKNTLLTHPKLYKSGQNEQKYNTKLFIFCILESLWQSLVIFYVPYFVYRVSEIDVASLGDIWTVGAVVVVNCQLAVDVVRWNWAIHAFVWGTVIATAVCVVILDSVWVLPGYWAIYHVMGSGVFWALLIFITVVALLPHFVTKVFWEYFLPDDIQIAREMEKFKGNLIRNSRPEVQMRMFEQ